MKMHDIIETKPPPSAGQTLLPCSGLRLDDLLDDFGLLHQESPQDADESVRKKRDIERPNSTHRDFTHSPHLEPPYARRTVFWRLEIEAYSRGRRAGI
jgi:hypothetical protein